MDALPYCGAPLVPAEVWSRWNTDPVLLSVLAVTFLVHLASLGRHGPWRPGAFMAAWGLIALLFISPFCALTSALFSARTLHHVLLVGVVPPLLLLAGAAGRVWRGPNAGVLALVNGAVLLVWHLPAAYTLALADTYAYWLMQVTLFGSALAFWAAVLAPGDTGGALVGLALATTLGGLLGVLLTFLPVPVYAFHLSTTPAWSMAPLVDQQLAGALMWTLGTLPYLAAAIALVARRFQAEVG